MLIAKATEISAAFASVSHLKCLLWTVGLTGFVGVLVFIAQVPRIGSNPFFDICMAIFAYPLTFHGCAITYFGIVGDNFSSPLDWYRYIIPISVGLNIVLVFSFKWLLRFFHGIGRKVESAELG